MGETRAVFLHSFHLNERVCLQRKRQTIQIACTYKQSTYKTKDRLEAGQTQRAVIYNLSESTHKRWLETMELEVCEFLLPTHNPASIFLRTNQGIANASEAILLGSTIKPQGASMLKVLKFLRFECNRKKKRSIFLQNGNFSLVLD